MLKIPEHDDEALKELESFGFAYFDYAKYLNPEKTIILAYKRWGKGFRRYEIRSVDEDEQNG